MMPNIILAVVVFIVVAFGFNRILGTKKEDIVMNLDTRHADPDKQADEIVQELESKGKDAAYQKNGEFLVDGKRYRMQVKSQLAGAGISNQRTVLTPVQEK